MPELLLTIDARPSSIRFAMFRCSPRILVLPEVSGWIRDAGDERHARLTVEHPDGRIVEDGVLPVADRSARARLAHLLRWLREREFDRRIVGVGHRVVHGGWRHARPVILDAVAVGGLRDSLLLAPLRQSHNLEAIEALRSAFPALRQVACFDTDFHRRDDAGPPSELPFGHGAAPARGQGFHGLAYQYVADVLPDHLGARADGCVVVAHLDDSSSLCAMRGGRRLAATTRFAAGETASGATLPDVFEAATADRFCYRIVREIGALAAAVGGLDALVFTGAVGARAAPMRSQVCGALNWLGVELDATANEAHAPRITRAGSRVDVLVLPANEEWIVACQTADRLRAGASA